jgi:hypothetical protein
MNRYKVRYRMYEKKNGNFIKEDSSIFNSETTLTLMLVIAKWKAKGELSGLGIVILETTLVEVS